MKTKQKKEKRKKKSINMSMFYRTQQRNDKETGKPRLEATRRPSPPICSNQGLEIYFPGQLTLLNCAPQPPIKLVASQKEDPAKVDLPLREKEQVQILQHNQI